MNAMAEIRKRYGVPAFRGRKVLYQSNDGLIVGATDTGEIRVRVSGDIIVAHPTELAYPRKPPRERTTRSQVRSALRKLWLHSPEHTAALRKTGYRCDACGVKKSVAKGREVRVEVHHLDMIQNWDKAIDAVFAFILCGADRLRPLCEACHEAVHKEEAEP